MFHTHNTPSKTNFTLLYVIFVCLVNDVSLMVKIQVIQSDEEKHSLSQDLARILTQESDEMTDALVEAADGDSVKTLKVNSFIVKARSPVLWKQFKDHVDKTNRVSFRKFLTFQFKLQLCNSENLLVSSCSLQN